MLERIEQTFRLLKARGYAFKTLDQITVEDKVGHAAHLPAWEPIASTQGA
jgi:hypothetical protein